MTGAQPKTQRQRYCARWQRGFTTLVTTLLLLLATTLLAIYTASTSVFEQQISGNQYRAEQSLAAAQGGLDAALDYFNRFDETSTIQLPTVLTETLVNASYSASFCDVSNDANRAAFWSDPENCIPLPTTCPTTGVTCANCTQPCGFRGGAEIGIVSIGSSDDGSGRRVITQLAGGAPLLEPGAGPFMPVLARASVGLTGTIVVINRYHNSTVWAGGPAGSDSNAVETYINDGSLNPFSASRSALTNHGSNPYSNALLATKRDIGINADVRDNDQTLSNLTPTDLFDAFFVESWATTRALAQGAGQLYVSTNSAVGKTGLIWVEGATSFSHSSGDIGNVNVSTVVVVDGHLSINGGTIYGLVFVNGNLTMAGNVVIKGAVVVVGEVGASGTPHVVYDPEAFMDPPEGRSGRRGLVAGTWKDWLL